MHADAVSVIKGCIMCKLNILEKLQTYSSMESHMMQQLEAHWQEAETWSL